MKLAAPQARTPPHPAAATSALAADTPEPKPRKRKLVKAEGPAQLPQQQPPAAQMPQPQMAHVPPGSDERPRKKHKNKHRQQSGDGTTPAGAGVRAGAGKGTGAGLGLSPRPSLKITLGGMPRKAPPAPPTAQPAPTAGTPLQRLTIKPIKLGVSKGDSATKVDAKPITTKFSVPQQVPTGKPPPQHQPQSQQMPHHASDSDSLEDAPLSLRIGRSPAGGRGIRSGAAAGRGRARAGAAASATADSAAPLKKANLAGGGGGGGGKEGAEQRPTAKGPKAPKGNAAQGGGLAKPNLAGGLAKANLTGGAGAGTPATKLAGRGKPAGEWASGDARLVVVRELKGKGRP